MLHYEMHFLDNALIKRTFSVWIEVSTYSLGLFYNVESLLNIKKEIHYIFKR